MASEGVNIPKTSFNFWAKSGKAARVRQSC